MDMRIRKLYCQLLWLGIFSLALSAPQKFDVYVASDRGISQAKLSYLVKQTEKPPLVYSTKENHGPKFLLANTAANNRIVPSGAENSKNFRQYINSRHYSANKQRFASRPITENIQQSISSGFKYNTQPSVRTGDFSNGQKSLTNQLDQSSSITKDSINSASLLSPSKRNTRSNKSPSILSSMFRNMKGFRDIVPPTNQLQRPRDISSYWPDIANDRLQPIINDVMFQEEDDRVLKRSGHVFLPPLSTTEVSTENQNSMSATITSVYRTEQNSNVDLQQSSSSLDIQPKHKIESHPNSSDDVYQLPIHYNILNPKIEIREDRNQQTTFSVNLDKNIDTGKIMISYTDSKTPNYSFGEKDLHKVVKNADIKGTIGETLKGMAHETKKDLVHLLLHKFPYNTREISSKPKNIRERGKNFIDNGKMYQTLYRLAKAIPLNKVSNEIAINQTAIESDTFSNNIGVVNNTMIQQHESPKKSSEGKNDRFVTNENTTKTTTPSIPGNSIISQSSSSPAVQSSTALIATKNKNTKQSNVEQQNKYYNKFPPKSNSVLSVTSNATKETLVRKNNTRIHSSTSASPSFVLANLQSNLEVKVKQMDMATVRTLDDSGAHVFGFQTTEKNPYSFTQIITSGTLKGNPFKSTSTQSKSYPSTTVTAGEIQNTGTDVTSTNTSLVSETTGYLNNSTDRLPTIATPNTTNLTNLLPTFISEITKSSENITEVSTMKTIQYMKDISNVESLSGTTLPPNILGSQYLENLDENKNNFVTSAQKVAPNELSIDLEEISDYIEQFINIKNKSKRLEKIQKDTTIVSTIKDHENKDAKDIENRDIKGFENKTVRGDKNKIFKGSELKSIENKDIKANQNNDSENKDGKVSKNKDVRVSKNKDVKRSKTKDFKSIKNKSVEHKENKDVKSNKNKDVKSRKNKDAESSKTKGVKRSEKKDVKSSKIKDTKRSEKKDDKGSKKTDVKGSKNKDVEGSENRDIKGSDHKNVKDSEINYVKGGETKDVSKDGIGSKNKGVKGSEKEDVKGSGKRDDKSSKSKDVERSKNKDIKRSGNKDVKRSENKDVTVSENKDVRGSENKDTKGSKNKDVIIQIHSTAQNYSNNQENKDSSILYTNGHQPFPVKASEVDIKVNIRQDGKEIEDLVSIDTSKGKYEQNTPIVDTSNTTVEFRDGKTLYDSVLTATENSTGNGKADLSSKSKTLQRMNVSSGSTRGDIIGASDFEKFDSVANPNLRREEVNFTLNITIPTVTKRNIEQNKSKNIYRAEADINKITAIALDNNITGTNEKEDGSHAEKVINENIAKETQNPKKLGTIKRRKSKNNFRNGENKSQADLRSGITITEHNAENATMKHSDKIKISITKKRKVKKDSKKSSKRRTGKNQNSSDTKKKTPTERYVVSTETVSSGKGNKFKTLKNVSGKEKKEKEKKEVKQETAWLNKTVETRTNERNELTEEKKKLKQKVSKLKTDVIKRDREKTHFTTIKKKRKKVNEKAKKKRTSSHKSSDIKKNNTIETEALFKQKGFQPAKKSHKDEGGNVSIKETTTKEKNDTEQMKQRNDLFKKISPRKEQNVLNKQENKRQNPRSNIQKSNQTEAKSVKKKIEDKSYPTNTTMKLVPVSNKKERDNASQTRDTRNPVFVESNKTAMARERKGIKVTTINDSKSQNISTNTTMEKKIAKKTVLKNREKKQSNITQQKSNRKNKQTKEIKTSNENLIENMKKSEVGRNATKEEDVAGGNLNKTVLSTEVPVNVREELKKIVSHKAETQVNKVALIRQEAPSITARTSTEVIPLQTVMTTLPSPIPMTGGGSVVNSLFPRITKSSSGQVKQTMSNRISDSKIPYGLVSSVEGSVDTLPTAKASLIQTSNNEETMNTLFDYNTLNQNASERMVQPQTTKTDNNTALPLGERDYSFPLQTNRILNERKRDGSQNAKDVDSVLKSPVSGNQLESLMPPPPIIPTSTARTATEQIIRFIGKASDLVEKLNEKKKRVSNMMVNIEHEKGNTLQPTSEAVKIYYNSSTERAKNLTENIPNDYQKPDPLNKNHNKVNTKQYDADKDLGKGQRILEDYRKLLIDNRKSIKTSAFDSDVNSLHQNVLNGVNSKSIFNGVKRNGEQPFVEWLARRDNLHLNKGIPPQIPTIQDGSENVKSEVRSGNTIPDILKSNLNTRGFIKPLLPSVNRTLGQRTNSAPCNSSLGKEEIMSLAVNVLRLLVSNLKLQQALQRSHENIVSTNLLSRKYLLIPLPQGNAQTNHSDRHANKLDKQIIRKGSYSSASFLQNQIESFLKKSPMQANMDQTPQVKQRLIRKRPSAGPLSHKVSSVVDKKIKRKVIHKHGKGILQNTLYNNLSTRSKQHKEKATYRENEMKDDNVENHLPKLETRIKFHTTKSKKN
ncbi:uncharacterized protein MAL13P1.304-like [Saccostrea cucullata]|uniref:uncharacterized protein MAL13P1.304-like n=1 Tax=Saccostrea cuccullata TaxID=36930 RepID=UPI002ED18930